MADAKNSDYLDPEGKRYQFKKDGKVSESLLRTAIDEAKKNNDINIFNQAQELYNDHCI